MAPDDTAWIWTGEAFAPLAGLPVSDRGFRYGMALFETLRIHEHRPLFLSEHAARLAQSAREAGFRFEPPGQMELLTFFETRKLPNGVARLHLTAGDGGATDPADSARLIISCEQRYPPEGALYQRGYRIAIHPQPYTPLFGGLKTHNYWPNLEALRAARVRGFDETLLFNPAGELISAAMANVFVVIAGKILTPPLQSGARAGVVRAWLLEHQRIEQEALTATDVGNASQVFLTSSWLGVMPGSAVESTVLEGGSTAHQLLFVYERHLNLR